MADEKKPVQIQLSAREEDWLTDKYRKERAEKRTKGDTETAKKVAARFLAKTT